MTMIFTNSNPLEIKNLKFFNRNLQVRKMINASKFQMEKIFYKMYYLL